jgi:hypothetical protein
MIVLIIVLPLMSYVVAEGNGGETEENEAQISQRLRRLFAALKIGKEKQKQSVWFFKEAEKGTLEGTIVGRAGNIVVLDNDDEVNIVMHNRWFVEEGTILSLAELFETYISIGDLASMEVLIRTVVNDNGVSVTYYFCYEINDYHGVMPGNIDG